MAGRASQPVGHVAPSVQEVWRFVRWREPGAGARVQKLKGEAAMGSVFGGIVGALGMLLVCGVVVAVYWLARWAGQRSPNPQRTLRLTGLATVVVAVLLTFLTGAGHRTWALFYFLTLLGIPAGLGLVPPAVFVDLVNRVVGGSEPQAPKS